MTSKEDTPTDVSVNSIAFKEMAIKIDHNANTTFGGAAVIVAPDGEKVELLLLDASADPAQFWGTVSSRIEIILDNYKDKMRNQRAFGVR